jgi:hypothetical protein
MTEKRDGGWKNGSNTLDRARQAGYLGLGFLMLGLGLVGAVLPVMPTTVFIILAAFFFGRSSPRVETWLLDHPRFGETLRAWREEGAIPTRVKFTALAGMAAGYGVFLAFAHPGPGAMIAVAAFMLAGVAYVLSRPKPGGRTRPPAG